MKSSRLTVAVCSLLLVVGCSTNRVNLQYSAEGAPTAISARAGISVGQFNDARGEPANWFGAIRGGFGNPIKVMETDKPVSSVVASAFSDGLKTRQALASPEGGAFELRGTVKRFDCDQYARREATAEIEVTVKRLGDGAIVYYGTKTANNIGGSAVTLAAGVFGSVEELRKIAEQTLREVVDKTLDDPEFRKALQ